jgi:predicted DNA-binding protein
MPRDLDRQLVLRIDENMHGGLVALAAANDRTVAQEARRAIRLYLEDVAALDADGNYGVTP